METKLRTREVSIPAPSQHLNIPSVVLTGDIAVPAQAKGMVIFSHGSGSSRLNPRNRWVAEKLQEKGFGTLLFDLLTEKEDEVYRNRFNIDLLTERLIAATQWLASQPEYKHLKPAYFGASTGAASALKAAARVPSIKAVVSRGGRPDLAIPEIQKVQAPVLLIVGALDYDVIDLNEQAAHYIEAPKELAIVEGAGHLFEEPGKMDEVATLAADWFEQYLK